jgi:hypothetical protein
MKLGYKLLVALIVTAILSMTIVPAVAAQANKGASDPESIIEQLEPYVVRADDGTFSLDIPEGVIDLTGVAAQRVLTGMSVTNALVRAGYLVTTPNNTAYDPTNDAFVLQAKPNEFNWKWYGYELWLSHETCQLLIFAGSAAIAASVLGSRVPGIPGWVAAGVGAWAILAVATIVYYDRYASGIHMKFLHGSVTPFFIESR